jgi:hypothetical protein
MAGKFSSHVRSNVVGYVAVFIALSGTTYAAVQLPKNSVKAKQIKANAVGTSEAKDNALTGQDVNEATLGQVPSAQSASSAQSANTATSANTAGDADLLDGRDSGAFLGANSKAADADLLDGQNSSAFLGAGAKAADANLLDGQDSSEFLGTNEKAADADQLDGQDSTAFGGFFSARIRGIPSTSVFSVDSGAITGVSVAGDPPYETLSPSTDMTLQDLAVQLTNTQTNGIRAVAVHAQTGTSGVSILECHINAGETACSDPDAATVPAGSRLSVNVFNFPEGGTMNGTDLLLGVRAGVAP